MNYIKQLEQAVAQTTADNAARAERLQEFRQHLLSSKYDAIQADGSRGDLISTGDVFNWLRYIEFGM